MSACLPPYLLNIANQSDKSRVCLFAVVAGWIRLPSPQRGRGKL